MKKVLLIAICAFSISTLFAQRAQHVPAFKKAIMAEAAQAATNYQIPEKERRGAGLDGRDDYQETDVRKYQTRPERLCLDVQVGHLSR